MSKNESEEESFPFQSERRTERSVQWRSAGARKEQRTETGSKCGKNNGAAETREAQREGKKRDTEKWKDFEGQA